ncbi:histone-lysine N-methyltransferase SETDB2 isoform X4 [Trichechus manatus latirostris]|uniref:Histone-lysine N-methyltransferase SETDB2 isoform X4 n=1 Tax=Trichechus manatus latirostris TaxID=127582 RepID=A0A2Y9QVD6_TRIMA|nr:histone-lysine N-methyltransferase SETDB2 isoform X4 [Trichechus manatus latirostris]
MAQACQPGPDDGLCGAEAKPAWGALPLPTGVFQVAEKLEKKTCALCPKGLDYSVLYFAQAENVAAHENCLLYSSALVECEDHDPFNPDRNFDVESVKKEIHRGKKLKCTYCGERGATVGCDRKKCTKNYHFFCAKSDHAFLHVDEAQGIYKVFCQQHTPEFPIVTQIGDDSLPPNNISGMKRKKGKKKHLSTGICGLPEAMAFNRLIRHMNEESGRHTDAVVKVAFLKKCKEAGLLNDLFEEILDKLHLIQERLVNETTSDSDYEEIGTSLLDCRLFEDTFVNFQAAIENKIHQSEQRQQQLKKEIELLQDLKQRLYLLQENRGLRSGSTSVSSLSS